MYCAFEMCGCVEDARELPGHIVIPKRGRDSGRPCVVLRWIDEDYVLIADGKLRTAAKPKKKKMKHLVFTGYRHIALHLLLSPGGRATDGTVREGLAAFSGITGKG